MFYGLLIGVCFAISVTYFFVYDVKNRKTMKNLQQQINALTNKITEQNNQITYLKNNSHAKIAYDILKDNCRKMGTCHLFK
jgi:cell division protein FtsL